MVWDETSLESWSILCTLNSWDSHSLYPVLNQGGEQKQHDIPARVGSRWRLGDFSQDAADVTEKLTGCVFCLIWLQ